ncbi:AcrR family transcriptional regulator [Herbaspirillum rubrisubalbicans]|uniref:TetR/AcrR family transcriptional regulator n=1 Tax=Herbaspirillum rubrisubalbicans TaxID=80842 RepID=UPI00209F0801|nr:TetR/AcrR family transcriptional regulator [Herbaspirillum rubrisubalbicans]MCP1572694.1 AcrR family transcriptional regulator [Herbaspirillum rubrisubalbicans]
MAKKKTSATAPTPSATPATTTAAEDMLAPRRMPNQARSRETVELVLRAAGTEIEQNGLDSLTTRRIAALAGISVGTLYEYFPNKQAIVYALVTDWMERILAVMDALHPQHPEGCQDMLTYLGTQVDQLSQMYIDQPGLGALVTMLSSVPQLRDAVREHDERSITSVASALQHFAPGVEPAEARSMAHTIIVIAHELLCEAIVREAPDAATLIRNLKVCVFALAARLQLSSQAL